MSTKDIIFLYEKPIISTYHKDESTEGAPPHIQVYFNNEQDEEGREDPMTQEIAKYIHIDDKGEFAELTISIPLATLIDDEFNARGRPVNDGYVYYPEDKIHFDLIKADLLAMVKKIDDLKYIEREEKKILYPNFVQPAQSSTD